MNNLEIASIDYMVSTFREIKLKGYIESIANYENSERNDGAVGDTYEHLLGEKRNNISGPDHRGWEIKTKRSNVINATSLFSLKPSSPNYGNQYTLEKYGIFDGFYTNAKKLNTTLRTTRISKIHSRQKPGWEMASRGRRNTGYCIEKYPDGPPIYSMRLGFSEAEQKIYLEVLDEAGNVVDKNVYWNFQDLQTSYEKKFNKAIFINADVLKKNGIEYFHYKEALLIEPTFEEFISGIKNGLVRFDHKFDIDRSGPTEGQQHDHGSGFRVDSKSDFKKIFSNIIEVN